MKLINYFWVFAVSATLYSCHSDNKPTSDSRLLFAAEIDKEDDDGISIVSSPDGSICLYSRNSTSKDATMGWSILYDVRDKDTVYTYEGLPDWQGEVSDIKKYFLCHILNAICIFSMPSSVSAEPMAISRLSPMSVSATNSNGWAYGPMSQVSYAMRSDSSIIFRIITSALPVRWTMTTNTCAMKTKVSSIILS